MDITELGRTGIRVSRLCVGTLTMGPLQANIGVECGAELIRHAIDRGVFFFDTAELYGTYGHLRRAMQGIPRESVVIASRCYAYTYDGMRRSLERALAELGTDYIDIFGLHEQESRLTLRGHADAIQCLLDAKQEGLIRAAGVSTHTVEVVRAVSEMREIDVVHPIFNKRGIGIIDGNTAEMADAIQAASRRGAGVYSMKPLGGGHLLREAPEAIRWVLAHESVHSMAIGVKSCDELDADVAIASGLEVSDEVLRYLAGEKHLLIEEWCSKCGACVKSCRHGALKLGADRAEVDANKCVLCGYCVAYCRDFCIKVV